MDTVFWVRRTGSAIGRGEEECKNVCHVTKETPQGICEQEGEEARAHGSRSAGAGRSVCSVFVSFGGQVTEQRKADVGRGLLYVRCSDLTRSYCSNRSETVAGNITGVGWRGWKGKRNRRWKWEMQDPEEGGREGGGRQRDGARHRCL